MARTTRPTDGDPEEEESKPTRTTTTTRTPRDERPPPTGEDKPPEISPGPPRPSQEPPDRRAALIELLLAGEGPAHVGSVVLTDVLTNQSRTIPAAVGTINMGQFPPGLFDIKNGGTVGVTLSSIGSIGMTVPAASIASFSTAHNLVSADSKAVSSVTANKSRKPN